ncbi:MAG TPA: trehalose-phosphatase [Bdellovibrionales bacterium]|nr:MAG: trehalose-phosphatase [Bdellovibrionales bacterium GWB1_52_6]OFZ05357.1 MAG: trehalose-phosphatase [Bdellovibrionales bacterium GWA1_52_35]OFZ36356.1 MAG: trehalose-phosphatase [Bdellovibrionales bacterium GWC1_52_8]HAR41077.1 trehalose-phosphatase [Bdellovibrionales bacterium]HCM39000.1 trehalose-phosphatase [Bdellovibrionales bacterium]
MDYLFGGNNIRVLESLSFTETLYAFDFDGTLAPIVADPDKARMSKETERLLEKLSSIVPIAIISGRGLKDLAPKIPPGPKYLIGNHGLEGLPSATAIHELEDMCGRWKAILNPLLKKLRDPGVFLEDKGYSLAIHYRNSRLKKRARESILAVLQSIDNDAKVIPGKLVLNLVPARGPHKGLALSRVILHSRAKFGFYIGDDYTDEDVFSINERRLMTVRVGRNQKSQARYYLRRQSEITLLLQHLLRFHESKE